MDKPRLMLEVYERGHELSRLGNHGARAAQEENRRLGVPDVYSINGIRDWEHTNDELSRTDPYDDAKTTKPE